MKKLSAYTKDQGIKKELEPIVKAIASRDIGTAEKSIARLALKMCRKVKLAEIAPSKADEYFTVLDIFLGEAFQKVELSEEAKAIILEGMIFHDYPKSYGTDMDFMRSNAKKILSR